MKLEPFQIIIVGISLLFIVDRFIKFFRHEQRQSFLKFMMINFIWLGVLTFIVFPNLAHVISDFFGLGRDLNTLIFIGFIIVFGLIYKLLTIIERMEKEIVEIVRKDALKVLENEKR